MDTAGLAQTDDLVPALHRLVYVEDIAGDMVDAFLLRTRMAGRRLREPTAPKANPYYPLLHRQMPDEWNIYLPWKQVANRELARA